MTAYIVRRLLMMLPVALFASVILFGLLKMTPGDPVRIQLGEQVNEETAQALRRELGLDQPLPVQYIRWLSRVVQGDFGRSLRNGAPVLQELTSRLPATLQLGLASLILSLLISVPLGVFAAVFRRSRLSFLATAFTTVGVSLPGFFFGLVLIYAFALQWRIFPPGSYVAPSENLGEWARRLVLPAITLSLFGAATQTRFIRSGLLDTLHQDYIRTARAKGLPEKMVIAKHALRNSLIPSVTLIGLQVGAILEGAFITETIFAWPGVGRLAVQALGARDYPIVQGVVLMAVFAFMFANLLVDIAYAYLDPRINYGSRR
ncbi:MAG TPA: ABC transporter permease [Chloroflexota bacterium]|nr:ABC transporter permease [Chloroflexota bacterium]